MNAELDRIIDRYRSGRMSPSEEHDFLRLLELDADLARMFRAEQVIVGAMQKDRTTLDAKDHSPSYAAFLRHLAVTATAPGAQATARPTSSASDNERMSPLRQTLLSLLVLLGCSALLITMMHLSADAPSAPPQRAIVPSSAPAKYTLEKTMPEEKGVKTSASTERTKEPAMHKQRGPNDAAPDSPRQTRAAQRRSAESTPQHDQSTFPRIQQDAPVFHDDTIRTRLKVAPSNNQ